jgi:CxxC-x17-CxxC domain-containing protein
MFSLVCSVCGAKSLVPFLPEEKENPMCQECYKRHLEERAADQNSTSNDA